MFRGHFVYKTEIDQPVEEVWAFFSQNDNLAAVTGFPKVKVTGDSQVEEGAVVHLKLDFLIITLGWQARIVKVKPGVLFQDAGEKVPFPFRLWLHTHHFRQLGSGRTEMKDEVRFSSWIPAPFVKMMLFGMFMDRKRQLGKIQL
ncbi:hypothetical protein CR205_08125 [Alteribacter lacisalsi]|uniref:SRPBCC family protein n=1 Tax=Alteribacter lacisalsi TaxID=2045244 RepID=A0A2W0HCF3_9BACI|nr:hypothetical protein [Alteribacter lacisalsi]PYZ98541.1 hypothetical protein CR205_08125 [Alteribacter lacisalsi]